jgi:hypothetical protein
VEAGGVISEPRSFDGVLARGQVESLVIGRRLRKHTPLRRAGELSLIIE